MDLVPGFFSFVQPPSSWMYAPPLRNLSVLIVNWIFASQRTVPVCCERHHSSFFLLFAYAVCSLDHVGLAWFDTLSLGWRVRSFFGLWMIL